MIAASAAVSSVTVNIFLPAVVDAASVSCSCYCSLLQVKFVSSVADVSIPPDVAGVATPVVDIGISPGVVAAVASTSTAVAATTTYPSVAPLSPSPRPCHSTLGTAAFRRGDDKCRALPPCTFTCSVGTSLMPGLLWCTALHRAQRTCAGRDSIFHVSLHAGIVSLALFILVLRLLQLPSFYMSSILVQFEPPSPPCLNPITFYHSDIPGLAAGSSLAYPRLLHVNKQYFACK